MAFRFIFVMKKISFTGARLLCARKLIGRAIQSQKSVQESFFGLMKVGKITRIYSHV